MILAPRSWPSSPGLATTTRILRPLDVAACMAAKIKAAARPAVQRRSVVPPAVLARQMTQVGPRMCERRVAGPVAATAVLCRCIGARRRGRAAEAVTVMPEDRVETALRNLIEAVEVEPG